MRSCADYSAKIPNVNRLLCEAAQLQDMQARSVLGRPIWGRDVRANDARLRVLVLGAIHGDEMSSSSLVFHWIAMAQTPTADTPLPIHWRFIPALNPDGMFAKPARRVNAHGVDLNRNFPTPNWARDARQYWEGRTRRDPRRWPGNKPLSEPESRFLLEQMDSFKPNLIVSVHAPTVCWTSTAQLHRPVGWGVCTWIRSVSFRARWVTMVVSTRVCQWSQLNCRTLHVLPKMRRCAKCG